MIFLLIHRCNHARSPDMLLIMASRLIHLIFYFKFGLKAKHFRFQFARFLMQYCTLFYQYCTLFYQYCTKRATLHDKIGPFVQDDNFAAQLRLTCLAVCSLPTTYANLLSVSVTCFMYVCVIVLGLAILRTIAIVIMRITV